MTSSSRMKLGWEVPDDRWDEFTTKVAEEWGEASLYAGIQIEQSWREYRDIHPLEDYANRLMEAAGLSRETNEKNNLPEIPSLADTESSRQFVRVHEDVKQEMKQYAAAHDLSNHEVLRGVIAWYLNGSREERLVEKFERAVPEAERAFAEAIDDGPDTSDGLEHTEKRAREIARCLGDSFTENELADAIDDKTSGSNYFHRVYTSDVAEYKGVRRWEKDDAPDLFLPLETWKRKMTSEIISELGGDHETSPPAFTKVEFAEAAKRAGLDVTSENHETVNECRDRVLERIEFAWSEKTEQFEPVDAIDEKAESNPNTAETGDEESDGSDDDVETKSINVTDLRDRLEGGAQIRADGGDCENIAQQDDVDAIKRVIDITTMTGSDDMEIKSLVETAGHLGVPKKKMRQIIAQVKNESNSSEGD